MSPDALRAEVAELRLRLEESAETLHAIRSGAVDAVVVGTAGERRVYTLDGADRAYRVWVEQMSHGAATLTGDGVIVYANLRLAALLGEPHDRFIGLPLAGFLGEADRADFDRLFAAGRETVVQAELSLRRGAGPPTPILVALNPLPPDSGAAVGVLVTDLTQQRHHEALARAHAALSESEQRLAFALKAGRMGTWDLDLRTGRLVSSDTCKANYGRGPGDPFTYADLAAAVHEDDRDEWRRAVDAAVASRSDLSAEYRVRWPDGLVHWVHVRGSCAADADGRVVSMSGVSFDVTQRRTAEQALLASERRFRETADAAPAVLWITDPGGACTFLSRGWHALTGTPQGEGLGSERLDAIHPGDRADAGRAFVTANARREAFHADYRLRRTDGQYRWAIDAGRPYFSPAGDYLGMVGSVIDIHDRKLAEEALQVADRRKDEFLATLAHELRNPLAPVRNGLQLLKMSPANSGVALKTREMMDRQLAHMVRLIDDLLDVSRISRGKVELKRERVALRSVIDAALEASLPLIEAARHELSFRVTEEQLWVEVDPTRMAQVMSNLLNNAAKYTPDGGRIQLSVERDGAEAVVRVADSGVGIPAEMLPKVFDIFTQVGRSIDRAQGGLGIGLSLVERLVEMHGGTVAADSPGLGMGSAFTVRVPLAAAVVQPEEPPASTIMTSPVSTGRRVLVVDDNVDGAESLAMMLELDGHETRTAHNGPDALEAAREFDPEVVFLDIGLPGMNGYEVVRRMREEPRFRVTVLVALTGWGNEEDKRMSREAGFDVHLTKPVEHAAVESILVRSTPSRRIEG